MSLFSRSYVWTESLKPGRSCRLPVDIFQELFVAAIHLPLSFADIRSPISTEIHCSDATPTQEVLFPLLSVESSVINSTVVLILEEGMFVLIGLPMSWNVWGSPGGCRLL